MTQEPSPAALESAAYPPLVRVMAVAIVFALAAFAAWSAPALSDAQWSFASLSTYALAAVLIAWVKRGKVYKSPGAGGMEL